MILAILLGVLMTAILVGCRTSTSDSQSDPEPTNEYTWTDCPGPNWKCNTYDAP